LEDEKVKTEEDLRDTSSETKRKKLVKRLKLIDAFITSGDASRVDDYGCGSGFAA
jgi:DNA-directed RNA polymerase subunit beta'